MTPEQKAKELIEKFKKHIPLMGVQDWGGGGGADYYTQGKNAKACALICVWEILNEINKLESFAAREYKNEPNKYWQSVKKSIKEEGQ